MLSFTLQPSNISSAGQTVRSRESTGSGASRRLMVLLVRAVSFTVMLAFTDMWLKPSRDGPSRVKKERPKRSFNIICYRLTKTQCTTNDCLRLTLLLVGASGGGSVRASGLGCVSRHSVPALVLTETFFYAVKQPVQRHAIHIPLPCTLVLLTCKTNTSTCK